LGASRPGTTETEVQADPTQADVRLLPPKTASWAVWLEAGRQTAKGRGEAVEFVPSDLRQAEVPAASIFEFVRGARSEAKESFKGSQDVEFFDPKNPQIVVEACRKQRKNSKPLAAFQPISNWSGNWMGR
jgi:hypothetical protein